MNEKEGKKIDKEERLFKATSLFYGIALLESIWLIAAVSTSVEIQIVWSGVLFLVLTILLLVSMTWAMRGNFNFIPVISKLSEPQKKDPLIDFKAIKLLDKYDIAIHFRDTYEHCHTDGEGIKKIKEALFNPKIKFININDLYYDNITKDKWISIDNISYIDEERRQDTQTGHYGISPKDAEDEMTDLIKQNYVIKEITSRNDEAKEIVEQLKKVFLP